MTIDRQQPDRRGTARPPPTAPTFERAQPGRPTTSRVGRARESPAADVAAAVDAATDAAGAWRRTTPTPPRRAADGRGRACSPRGPTTIAAEMVAEEGKPLADARNEASRTPRNLELYAGEAYRLTGATFPSDDTPLVYSVLDPVGVVGVITPWNFPLNLASRKIGPALGGREHRRLQAVADDAADGRPAGGRVHRRRPARGRAQRRARLRRRRAPGGRRARGAVTFTGSTATGRKIHAAIGLGRRVQLELGGKNPVIVLADADLEAAADGRRPSRASASAVRRAPAPDGSSSTPRSTTTLVERVVALAGAHVVGPGDRGGRHDGSADRRQRRRRDATRRSPTAEHDGAGRGVRWRGPRRRRPRARLLLRPDRAHRRRGRAPNWRRERCSVR